MPDVREVYEMVTKQKPSEPGALERQHTRQVRSVRNQKVGAFAVTAAIAVVAVALILGDRDPSPTVGAGATPEAVAEGFMHAFAALDTDAAIGYLADDAQIDGLLTWVGTSSESGTQGLQIAMEWLEATGFEVLLDSCEQTSTSTAGDVIRCTYDQHLLRSDDLGMGPYGPARVDFVVRGEEIVRIGPVFFDHGEAFSGEVWEPFAEWLTSTYPEDASVMYEDDSHSVVLISPRSIRLWEGHLREYIEQGGSPA
jgi:hypothetical protein